LFAIKNPDGEIELAEQEDEEETDSKYKLVTIKGNDYIKLNDKIYTIDEEGKPDEIYVTFTNGKFKYSTKSNDKIIVKGQTMFFYKIYF
jgi:hypothetical protein